MGRASNLVYGNTLKLTCDSIFPAVIAMVFHFICAVGGTFLFGYVLGLKAIGVFIGLTLNECVSALLYLTARSPRNTVMSM